MVKKQGKKKKNGSIPQIGGQGGYYTDKILPILQQVVPKGSFAKGGAHLGSSAGQALGSRFGLGSQVGDIASSVGRGLGSSISKLVGFGDYTVKENSLISTGFALQPGEAVPSFKNMEFGTRVSHREFITDVIVPASPLVFANTTYVINPGDRATFPWLSNLAANYQQYKFNGLVFEFKTMSSDISSGGALGSVIMATNYDVTDVAFSEKITMENAQYSISAKPSWNQMHTVECAPNATAAKLLYIRNASSTNLDDARFHDLGKFQLATVGLPGSAGQVLGELWASYDVTLYKPELGYAAEGSKISGGGVSTKTSIYGANPTVTGNLVSATVNTLTFLASGEFIVVVLLVGSGLVDPTISGTATATLMNDDNSTTRNTWQYRVRANRTQTFILDASGSASVTDSETRVGRYTYVLN